MKKMFSMASAALFALSLAACEQDRPAPPDPDAPVIVDEECPRADGTPCK